MNAGGTIIQFPFGYICTFPSRRHLFRGEASEYPYSESSLSRRCRNKNGNRLSKREIEILHVISNMRIVQFHKFIWQFDIIPQWEAKLSEINYKAMAQHYGFETFLLDLTNDLRSALFFATTKWVTDHFEPLSQEDIKADGLHEYGILYHTPDWMLDYLNGGNMALLHESFEKEKGKNAPSVIDTGLWDGVAYQIGLQPFYRSHTQYGYVYPMKTLADIKESGKFERIRFKQTEGFSRMIFDMMDGGKKIYPDEGINAVKDMFVKMQNATIFSEDDLLWAYKLDEADYDLFPTIESLRDTLEGSFTSNLLKSAYGLNNCKISFQSDEVDYPISDNTKKYINDQYNDKSFLDPVGNILHETYPSRQYRREIYRNIYGEYPPEES